MRCAVIDGHFRLERDATVSAFDRGFLYGDAVLESLRTYGGVPFELEAHLARLDASAEAVGFALPVSHEELAAEVGAGLKASGNTESSIRIIVSRGAGPVGLEPVSASRATRVVLIDDLAVPPDSLYRRGIRLRCIRTVRSSDAVHSAKLTNYVAAIVATRDARSEGDDDAAIVDARGHVIEGTSFNIFAAFRGRLTTPPAGNGVLDGVTRRVVLDLANEAGLEIALEAFSPSDLAEADEIFVTSTFREVLGVSHLDGRQLRSVPGPLTKLLHGEFRRRVRAAPLEFDEHPANA